MNRSCPNFGRARHSVRAVGGCGDGGGQRTARPTTSALMNYAGKSPLDPIFGLGGRAVGADAVLDGDAAAFVPAERRINQAVVVADEAEVQTIGVRFVEGKLTFTADRAKLRLISGSATARGTSRANPETIYPRLGHMHSPYLPRIAAVAAS